MTRLTFNKNLFTRHEERDFSDDGTKFRIYYYKDTLPISVARGYGMYFVSIRLDYADIPFEERKEDSKVMNEFNGCYTFDMDKFIENCEYAINKYLNKEKKEDSRTMTKRVKQIKDYSNTLATRKGTHTVMILGIDGTVTEFEDLNIAQYPILIHAIECDDSVEAYVVTDNKEVVYFD